jgi:hypothetical protein
VTVYTATDGPLTPEAQHVDLEKLEMGIQQDLECTDANIPLLGALLAPRAAAIQGWQSSSPQTLAMSISMSAFGWQ